MKIVFWYKCFRRKYFPQYIIIYLICIVLNIIFEYYHWLNLYNLSCIFYTNINIVCIASCVSVAWFGSEQGGKDNIKVQDMCRHEKSHGNIRYCPPCLPHIGTFLLFPKFQHEIGLIQLALKRKRTLLIKCDLSNCG